MNNQKLRPVCSVGMFDLLKGVAILYVIVCHCSAGGTRTGTAEILFNANASMANFFLYCFLIAAGFGIRKRPVKKCALQLKKMFLVPYVLTALGTALLYSVNYLFLSENWHNTCREGLRVFLGAFLGVFPFSANWRGFEILTCGPLWFVIALAGGWFLLDLILNYSQGWKRNSLVLLASLAGYFGKLFTFSNGIAVPFCIPYMFDFVLGLYVGYLSRERKWFEKKMPLAVVILICLSVAAFVWKNDVSYSVSSWDSTKIAYPLGIATPFAAAVVCFGITHLMTHINRRENPVLSFFETVGNNSITILCLHTVECTGMHWYWFRNTLSYTSNAHMFCFILMYRLILIAFGMFAVTSFRNWGGINRLKELLCRKKTQ